MLRSPRLAVATTAAAAAVVLLAGPSRTLGGPATAAAATEACDQALDHDRREVFRFKDGRRTLGYGRVVVTPTKASPNRYCVRVGFGGRTVTHRFDGGSYLRADGKWEWEGGLGSGTYRTEAYEQSLQVKEDQKVDRRYGIRSGGRWFETVWIKRING
jgi:hypothetical protein